MNMPGPADAGTVAQKKKKFQLLITKMSVFHWVFLLF